MFRMSARSSAALERKPEIVQPTFIHVIKVTVRTAAVYHCGSRVHHKPKSLFRKSVTAPEFDFRTLTLFCVNARSIPLDDVAVCIAKWHFPMEHPPVFSIRPAETAFVLKYFSAY